MVYLFIINKTNEENRNITTLKTNYIQQQNDEILHDGKASNRRIPSSEVGGGGVNAHSFCKGA